MIKKDYTTEEERNELIISMPTMRVVEDAIHINESYLLFISPEEVEPYILEISDPGPTPIELLQEENAGLWYESLTNWVKAFFLCPK